MTPAHENCHFLRQGLALVDALDDELFASVHGPARSNVGAHLRHCIDYYRCFLRGLDGGRVDYDARERQAGIETDRDTARAALADLVARLEAIDAGAVHQSLQIKVDTAAWHDPALHWSRSTVLRELQFLLSHTVHHYALIAQMLRARGFEPGEGFGVAPSTLEHRHAVAACAR